MFFSRLIQQRNYLLVVNQSLKAWDETNVGKGLQISKQPVNIMSLKMFLVSREQNGPHFAI